MSGTEYAIADAAVTGQLRSCVIAAESVLTILFKVSLAGWAIVAALALIPVAGRQSAPYYRALRGTASAGLALKPSF